MGAFALPSKATASATPGQSMPLAVGRRPWASTLDPSAPATVMNGGRKFFGWIEPTIPEELQDEAKKEGFRLRPKYSHMKIGYVVSDFNRKTRVAYCEYFLFSAKYGLYYKRSSKFHFHDEYEISKLGDVVLIAPYRRVSAKKSYRLIEVMKKNTAPTTI